MHSNTRHAACIAPEFNRLHGPPLFPEEMLRLKALAAPFVERCITR